MYRVHRLRWLATRVGTCFVGAFEYVHRLMMGDIKYLVHRNKIVLLTGSTVYYSSDGGVTSTEPIIGVTEYSTEGGVSYVYQ